MWSTSARPVLNLVQNDCHFLQKTVGLIARGHNLTQVHSEVSPIDFNGIYS